MAKVQLFNKFHGMFLACNNVNQLVLDKGEIVTSKRLWEFTNDNFIVNDYNKLALQVKENSQTIVLGIRESQQPLSKWISTSDSKIHLDTDMRMFLCVPKPFNGVEVRFCDTIDDDTKGGIYDWEPLSDKGEKVRLPIANHEIDEPDDLSEYGYPAPSKMQCPTSAITMQAAFFVRDSEWAKLRSSGEFDYIVVGSGFCGFAFVDRVLNNNPYARILILERGDYFLPQHFQNLPLQFKNTLCRLSETFPWSITKKMHDGEYIKWMHGQIPYLGGRSTLWSAWCPEPQDEDMPGWPKEVTNAIHHYFSDVKCFLKVIPASEIFEKDGELVSTNKPVYGVLQKGLKKELDKAMLPTVTRIIPAPLAVDAPHFRDIKYLKYSVPGHLLKKLEYQKGKCALGQGWPTKLATNCVVEKIIHNEQKATALKTNHGEVELGKAKLILAMGTLPPTTLVLNSFPKSEFPSLQNVGERLTAHIASSIFARISRSDISFCDELGDFEMGALYVAGVDEPSGQYHIQLSAVTNANPDKNASDALRFFPCVVRSPSDEQLRTSKDHIVFVCGVLGELDYRNDENWFRLNESSDPTSNADLQVVANERDNRLWDVMDEATFNVMEKGVCKDGVEYWHPQGSSGYWCNKRPPPEKRRRPGLVHEASTMWIGENEEAPVGLDYRLRGVENVYITGASLWPNGGSWNPTGAMVALAMHLADKLSKID